MTYKTCVHSNIYQFDLFHLPLGLDVVVRSADVTVVTFCDAVEATDSESDGDVTGDDVNVGGMEMGGSVIGSIIVVEGSGLTIVVKQYL